MDDQRRSLIITAIVTLFIIALIVGLIIFLVRFVQNRTKPQTNTNIFPVSSSNPNFTKPSSSSFSIAPLSPSSAPNNPVGPDASLYSGAGFQLRYPKKWGLLTCNNSQNFELDPTSSTDQLKLVCDSALKPVTVLVGGSPNCQGNTISLGNIQAVKSKVIDDNGVDYRWCTKTTPVLDITHRVSKIDGRATSKDDFSSLVEQMIESLAFASGS